MKPLLVKHLEGEAIGRFPVWLMRQAGRYLPRYREIRERYSFWEMATKPDVAAEVSLLPQEVLAVDGIILFQDILTLPYGMGIPIEMRESVGPVTTAPLRSAADFSRFESYDPAKHTAFVGEALDRIRGKIAPEMALLGFAGAPWTVACYLAEGRPARHFEQMHRWLHNDPQDLARALSFAADATLRYLLHQREHGAHVVQLFDTWLAEMPRVFFVEHYLPILNRIFTGLKKAGIPAIYFTKRAHHLLGDFTKLEARVLSVDELLPLGEVERRTDGKFSLQGNLDPLLLFCDPAIVRRHARALVAEARRLSKPAILNLGHGILPGTPVESVKAFVDEAREMWL
jgi:uroporphyrinogen decarboxylase